MSGEPRGGAQGAPSPEARPGGGPPDAVRRTRTWPRVAGLFLVVMALWVEPAVLVGVPYVLFVVSFPAKRLPALLTAGLVVALIVAPGQREGFWYAERAWAVLVGGWFVALTFRWPDSRFSPRALGAVGGSMAVAGLWMAVRPGSWSMIDWLVWERIRGGVSTALAAVRALQGEEASSQALATAIYQAAEAQANVFPAMVALASLAAVGVAWWLYALLAHGEGDGLGPAREFRFNDQLVWLLIGGLLLLAFGAGDGWSRAGSNAVVFMGALYALRGAAVVLFFYGGFSVLGGILLALSLVLVTPVILGGAVVIGLGDTWLDLRARARRLMT